MTKQARAKTLYSCKILRRSWTFCFFLLILCNESNFKCSFVLGQKFPKIPLKSRPTNIKYVLISKPSIITRAHKKLSYIELYAIPLLYNYIKCFRKNFKLWKISKYWSWEETWTSYEQKMTENLLKIYLEKPKKIAKLGKTKKHWYLFSCNF